MSALPTESPDDATCLAQSKAECRWAWRCCLASPLLAIIAWAFAAKYLLFVMYIQPPATTLSMLNALRWKPAIAVGLLLFIVPWCWFASAMASRRWTRFPLPALCAVLMVVAACLGLEHPRAKWFYVEWAMVRTPNPSFGRNTLMWEQRKFEQSAPVVPMAPLVRLVGSSQIYQGTDLALLNESFPDVTWEKNCLAGFGPMQYPWLLDVLLEPRPRLVVCWLSEFDFYREDQLPINRLRWASTPSGVERLHDAIDWPTLNASRRWQPLSYGGNWATDPQDQWSLRGDYADLGLASTIPLWRLRDHFRRTVFHYWQDVSRPSPSSPADGPQLAQSAEMALAQESLRNNVGRKKFVETNFRAFEQFARKLQSQNIALLVCEGATHPDATAVYDAAYRTETRQRLRNLSEAAKFQYLDETQMPRFAREDFADPYHLNEHGRSRFSRFLAETVRQSLATEVQTQHSPQ